MEHINRFLEHTVLKPDLNRENLEKAVRECMEYNFAGICIPPCWVNKTKHELGDLDIVVVSPAGFPLGYTSTEGKLAEIKQALHDGADEIDMVWNLSAFKSGSPEVNTELSRCCSYVHENNRVIKIIIETCYLSPDEIIQACLVCSEAGADFVKTSTGFGPAGARVEDVRLMRAHLASHIGIKAAGGIRTFASALNLIDAGADRIGTSSGPQIMNEALQNL